MGHLTFWQISAWAIAIGLSIVIFFELSRSRIDHLSLRAKPSRFELLLALAFTSMGLVLRFAFLDEFQAGHLTSDEYRLAIIYVSTIVNNELARGGATHLAFARGFDLWYQTVGFTPLLARSFSAFLGVVSLGCFFFGLLKVAGIRMAIWSTTFLSISLFGVYFSKLALETGWAIFIPPIVFLLLVTGSRHRLFFVAVSGFVLSLGIFSYPGLLMAIAAVIMGLSICYFIVKQKSSDNPSLCWHQHGKFILSFLAGMMPFTVYALHQHLTVYGGGQQLMTGNGLLTFDIAPLLDGMAQVMKDAFINADSWYMPYKGMPFFEITLLPLSVLGLFMFWRAKWPWYTYSVFVSIPICMAMVPFAGAYPGMRRALFVLLPYYAVVGGGFIYLLGAMTTQGTMTINRNGFRHSSYKLLVMSLLLLSVIQPVAYQFTTGRNITLWNFGEGFSKPSIPFGFMLTTLKTNDIVLDQKEFGGYFDDLIYIHYPRLYARYNADAGIKYSVSIVPNLFKLQSNEKLTQLTNKLLISWDARNFGQLATDTQICITPKKMTHNKENYPYMAFVSSLASNSCGTVTEFWSMPGSGRSYTYKDLGVVRKSGTQWNDGTVVLDEKGIEVTFEKPRTASTLDISFDNNDEYSVLFFDAKNLITYIDIKGSKLSDGLEVTTISLPKILSTKSFNRVQIIPIAGDGYYSVGHFILK